MAENGFALTPPPGGGGGRGAKGGQDHFSVKSTYFLIEIVKIARYKSQMF